jgi:hypothetical protein
MAKADKSKRGPGRPKGTGSGYERVLRVLLKDATYKALERWREKNKATSLSDAGRRIIETEIEGGSK